MISIVCNELASRAKKLRSKDVQYFLIAGGNPRGKKTQLPLPVTKITLQGDKFRLDILPRVRLRSFTVPLTGYIWHARYNAYFSSCQHLV